MTIISDLNLGNLSITSKRALIKELREAIAIDRTVARSAKMLARAEKAQARADKRDARIKALEAKLEALRNPVGAKAIKANRKAGKVTVTKLA